MSQQEQATEAEIRELKDGIKKIVNCAGERGLNIREFAIEIWENAVLRDVHYLAFSSLLLTSVTGLEGEACFLHIEEMIAATLSGDLETKQKAITMMADGLVEYNKPLI
ncbi:hypothetical protein QUA58_27035 [Microcoleus sp. N9_A1]